MKVLYFDLEKGSQTLGSDDNIQNIFGYPVLRPQTWGRFSNIIEQIYTKKETKEIKKVGGLEITEESFQVVPRNGTVVDTVVLDTFSELSKKFQRSLTDKDGTMKLNQWGRLKNKLDSALEFISQIPGIVILNCHSKSSTTDTGVTKVVPYIDGSTKEDISKWFDFVFYTKTLVNAKDERSYVWITKRSETYDHAKDRTDTLPAEIPQDYSTVIKAAKDKGFNNVRILVIGSPGSGKTMSLKTLTKGEKDVKNVNDK